MKNENYEHVLSIAKDLDKIANDELVKCPECGEWISESECEYNEIHDSITCCHCGAEFSSDDVEPASMWDYFEDCLDIEYYSKGRGADDYIGVRVMVAYGGPNIFIDTRRGTVELYWWTDSATVDISRDTVNAIDDVFSELWQC